MSYSLARSPLRLPGSADSHGQKPIWGILGHLHGQILTVIQEETKLHKDRTIETSVTLWWTNIAIENGYL